jgi:hypothetical protein
MHLPTLTGRPVLRNPGPFYSRERAGTRIILDPVTGRDLLPIRAALSTIDDIVGKTDVVERSLWHVEDVHLGCFLVRLKIVAPTEWNAGMD